LSRIIKQTDALNWVTTITQDARGNPIQITRPNGAVTTMTYDAKGNCPVQLSVIWFRSFRRENCPQSNRFISVAHRESIFSSAVPLLTAIYDLKTAIALLTTGRMRQIELHIPGGSNVPGYRVEP